jgi:hypothetical protein
MFQLDSAKIMRFFIGELRQKLVAPAEDDLHHSGNISGMLLLAAETGYFKRLRSLMEILPMKILKQTADEDLSIHNQYLIILRAACFDGHVAFF